MDIEDTVSPYQYTSEQLWEQAYHSPLRKTIRTWVYRTNIPGWYEQVEDITGDILQEAILRAYNYSQTQPIQNVRAFLQTTAYHIYVDLTRAAKQHLTLQVALQQQQLVQEAEDLSITVLEHDLRFSREAWDEDWDEEEDRENENEETASDDDGMLNNYWAEYWMFDSTEELFPIRYRTVLRLYFARYSYQEIAGQVDVPVSIVKRYICDGRTYLQQLLQQAADHRVEHDQKEEALSTEEMETYINQLPKRYQVPLRLYYIQNQTYQAIAEQLSLPLGTVKSLISRGKQKIEQLAQEQMDSDSQPTKAATSSSSNLEGDIQQLPKQYQRSVYLYCIEKLKYQEIAQQLHLPLGTVKSHISRGMKLLREMNHVSLD